MATRRRRGMYRFGGWLGVAASALLVLPALSPGRRAPASVAAVRTPAATFGVQDGSVNVCDAKETDASQPKYAGDLAVVSSPFFAPLGDRNVRFSPPWDVANPSVVHRGKSPAETEARDILRVEKACLSYWLSVVHQYGLTPEVAFKPDYNYVVKNRQGQLEIAVPSLATYRSAVQSFVDQYVNGSCRATTCPLAPRSPGIAAYPAGAGPMARVRIISPWGEPDDPAGSLGGKSGFRGLPQQFHLATTPSVDFGGSRCARPTDSRTCGPALAAGMWDLIHAACGATCNPSSGGAVIAGDFGPYHHFKVRHPGYLDTYARNLIPRPQVWALHPYATLAAYENAYAAGKTLPPGQTDVGRFASRLDELGYHSGSQIWMNEQGAGPTPSRAAQAAAGRYLLTELVKAGSPANPGRPRVTRAYYYNYGVPEDRDSMIVGISAANPTGSSTPLYCAFVLRAGNPMHPKHCTPTLPPGQ